MGDLINLRQAKKAKARAAKEKDAAANRTKFGVAKNVRDLNDARNEKARRDVEGHKKDE